MIKLFVVGSGDIVNSSSGGRIGFGINLLCDFEGGSLGLEEKLDGVSWNKLSACNKGDEGDRLIRDCKDLKSCKDLKRLSSVGRDSDIGIAKDNIAVVIDKIRRTAVEISNTSIRIISVDYDAYPFDYSIHIDNDLLDITEKTIHKQLELMSNDTKEFFKKHSFDLITGALIEEARGLLYSAHCRDNLFKDFNGDTTVIPVKCGRKIVSQNCKDLCEKINVNEGSNQPIKIYSVALDELHNLFENSNNFENINATVSDNTFKSDLAKTESETTNKDLDGDVFKVNPYNSILEACNYDKEIAHKAINSILGNTATSEIYKAIDDQKSNDCYDFIVINQLENKSFGVIGEHSTKVLKKSLCWNDYGTYSVIIKGVTHNIMKVDIDNKISELDYVTTKRWVDNGYSLVDVALVNIAKDLINKDEFIYSNSVDLILSDKASGRILGMKDNQVTDMCKSRVPAKHHQIFIESIPHEYTDKDLENKFKDLKPCEYEILTKDGYSNNEIALMYIAKDLLAK